MASIFEKILNESNVTPVNISGTFGQLLEFAENNPPTPPKPAPISIDSAILDAQKGRSRKTYAVLANRGV
jgi:hypothetical protein